MMEWLDQWIHTTILLAALGGFIGALRSAVKDTGEPFAEKVLDVVIGVLAAISVTDYFLPDGYPKIAGIIGLLTGSFIGRLMDALHEASPAFAAGLIEVVLGRFGYRRQPKVDNDNPDQPEQ